MTSNKQNEIILADSASVDAFSRLRISNPFIINEALHTYDAKEYLYTTSVSGGGTVTYIPNDSLVELSVGTALGDKAIRQSKTFAQYTAGQSLFSLYTAVFEAMKVGLTQKVGFFSDNDGIFYYTDGLEMGVCRRSSIGGVIVDNKVSSINFSHDNVDGTGELPILDITKTLIFGMDMQYLGVGRVRFYVDHAGVLHKVHEMLHDNILDLPYLKNPAAPFRYEIENTAVTASASTLKWICSVVMSEGDKKIPSTTRSVDSGNSLVTVSSASLTPVLSIRLKSAFNRATILPSNLDVHVTTNDDVKWALIFGGAISGGAWNSVHANSITEVNNGGTLTGGEQLASGYVDSASAKAALSAKALRAIASDYTGTSDIITLACQPRTGSASVFASLQFEELY